MYRARWGRLSGVGTSWTLLAASVLVVASSLSRGQAGGGVRGWSSGRLVPMPAGRGHGQHAAQEWARVHWCKCRMRHLRAKEAAGSESVGSRNMHMPVCMYEDGARAVWPLGGRPSLLRGAALVGGAAQRARARERRRSGGAGWGGTLAKRLWGASATLDWRTRVSGGKRPYLRSMQPGCDPGVGASRTVVRKTHTALVSQSLVGLCFAFPSIFVYVEVMWSLAARRAAGRT